MVFTILTALVILPLIGLAIDGSILYWTKAKLSAAVDAAALAAGRNPSANPSTEASEYVYANFPPGWMGAVFSSPPAATVDFPAQSQRRVTVTASVSVPLFFMRIIGQSNGIVGASAASSRRSVNVMLVLDRSSSMNNLRSDGTKPCDIMKASAQTFVNYFVDGQDQLGLITFHASATVDYPHDSSGVGLTPGFTTSFKSSTPSLNTTIGDLVCGSNTSSAMALNLAYKQIQALGPAAQSSNGVLNVIVFFTDGFPNGITALYPPKDQADNRYDPVNTSVSESVPATSAQCISTLNSFINNSAANGAGVIAQWAGGMYLTGATHGMFQTSVAPIKCASGYHSSVCNTNPGVVAATGCNFVNNTQDLREDVAYIPQTDFYGNSTQGYMTNYPYVSASNDWVSSGPYSTSTSCPGTAGPGGSCGFRVDSPEALDHAAFNAADSQAQKIIHDTLGFNPVIYVIGLGGASDMPSPAILETFCRRVANDPTSPIYDSSRPTGLFVYSPDDTQLQAAFETVASQILRLSK
jgi:Flp pilus assembly protein TadG